MTRGEVSYHWKQVPTTYVPTFKLVRAINAITTANAVAGWNGDVVVAQDINKERWLWGFSLRKVGNKHARQQASGHAPTLEEAKEAAELAAGKVV